jgi:hypothetical protein
MIPKTPNVKISKSLRDIIHGYIMSDGYVSKTGILTVDQSIKQTKFVQWLYEQLEPVRTEYPITNVLRTRTNKVGSRLLLLPCPEGLLRSGASHSHLIQAQGRGRGKAESTRFNTRAVLAGFRAMWYKPFMTQEGELNYRKSLPKSLRCFFNPIFISLWFAGDGTKMLNQKGAKFEATSFTEDERLLLKNLFKEKFNINVKINRAGLSSKGVIQWSLSINAPEYAKFRELITKIDLIPTLFPYKLHSIPIK